MHDAARKVQIASRIMVKEAAEYFLFITVLGGVACVVGGWPHVRLIATGIVSLAIAYGIWKYIGIT
jgi:hypothetical protein